MHEIAHIFAIRICAYAVMSNHYHLVLYVDTDQAHAWSDEEVIQRWALLFPMSKAHTFLELNLDFDNLTQTKASSIKLWRQQLMDISWFMRKLNETIARQANKEDECTGRFWEGRFKSQALLDDSALLACMAYVDLNPIRAGINQTPETSDFTSIQERIQRYKLKQDTPESLASFEDEHKNTLDTHQHALPCSQLEYFELVDATGRIVKSGKKGAIPPHLKPILERLSIKTESWSDTITKLGRSFASIIGRPDSIETYMIILDKPRLRGLKQAKAMFKE
tara:strand:+ start:5626 stop:6462 length:837 start_codon:yes stop_codon:yes gene_type:complete